jgi:hypothetical protein
VLLSAAVLTSCTSASSPPPVHATRPQPAPSSPRPGGDAFGDGYAVWPQDTIRAALQAPSEAWRDDPNAVAAQFATHVLGWSDARIKTLRFGVRTARVEVSAPGSDETLDMELRAAPSDIWSVLNVMPHGEYLPTVAVRGRKASVGVELEGEATSADVTVGYGLEDKTVTTHRDGTVEIKLAGKPDTSGHFLVLARDADGNVISATGSTLPAGHFAAS